MHSEQLASGTLDKPLGGPVVGRAGNTVKKGSGWVRVVLVVFGLAALGCGGAYLLASGREQGAKAGERVHAAGGSESSGGELRVQVVNPERGGMARITSQPGTIRAFEYAQLYAKVSGYVKTLKVDRGSRVKKGDLLAEIDDPERDVAVDQAQAALEHSHAAVAQAQASILSAQASVLAAKAQRNEAKSVLEQKKSERDYRKKEYGRIVDLVKKGDVEERLADEEHDHYLSAEGSVHSAEAGIETSEAQIAEATAKLEQAKADLKAAQAGVKVSEANLELARVFVTYTRIVSPFDGVITDRGDSVHPGTFIRSAAEGMGEPLLTVSRDDKMRTIVLVPDRDVPYCKVGQIATVELDALAGRVFKAPVSRIADSEDLKDRTMRIEIDIENPDRALKDGMFGRAEILLENVITDLTIPSSCLLQRDGRGDAAILVVRDGEVHRAKIRVGIDNGLRVEVAKGLTDVDHVILQPDASLADGTKVQVDVVTPQATKGTPAGHA
jgi:HlyD family secretion protein